MPTAMQWRAAFARQARADLSARDQLLANAKIPASQHLHFLQMACEKLCKAHLCGRGADVTDLQRSHAFIGKQLPLIAREQLGVRGRGDSKWLIRAIRSLARRIELLAPAVDDGGRHLANCEYPWADAQNRVVIPAEHDFQIDLQRDTAGRRLAKIIHSAVAELGTE